jgi:hypothetical protein
MTGLKSYDNDLYYKGHYIRVLDPQQRLHHSFAVILNGYHTFCTVSAARKFIRSTGV